MKYQFYLHNKYFITYSIDKKGLFFDEQMKKIIMTQLFKTAKSTDTEIEPYAILNNHLHFIASSQEKSISKIFLKNFAGASSHEINKYLNQNGKLWDKYYGWAIFNEKAYFNILAYILGNPIRHGMAKSFAELYDYAFCNFKQYADEYSKDAMEERVMSVLKIKSEDDEKEFFYNLSCPYIPH
jgi:putative transposase